MWPVVQWLKKPQCMPVYIAQNCLAIQVTELRFQSRFHGDLLHRYSPELLVSTILIHSSLTADKFVEHFPRSLLPILRHIRLLPGAHAAIDEEHLAVDVPGVVAAQIDRAAAADVALRHLAAGRVQFHPAAKTLVAVDDGSQRSTHQARR